MIVLEGVATTVAVPAAAACTKPSQKSKTVYNIVIKYYSSVNSVISLLTDTNRKTSMCLRLLIVKVRVIIKSVDIVIIRRIDI